MARHFILSALALLALTAGCTKEEPLLNATLHATCKGCVVSYAGGVMQSLKDTLYGMVDPDTGDTLAEERSWTVHLKDGDNLFFRACRLDSLSTDGISLWVDGDVRPMQAGLDGEGDCAEINQLSQGR